MYSNILIIILVIIALYYIVPRLSTRFNNNLENESLDSQKPIEENWANYQTPYYDYALTGNDPLMYYAKPMYRRPYRYPFTFFKSYPYPHMSYQEDPSGH